MNITNSPDITVLQVKAVVDLSTLTPTIKFTNLSQGAHLANMKYYFEIYSPNDQPVHVGNLTTPDASGAWTVYNMNETLPYFGSAVEWSGKPYRINVHAQDSAGKIFHGGETSVYVSCPRGNNVVGKNWGEGKLDVSVNCEAREALIRDLTPYIYRGVKGKVSSSSSLTIIQPASDETGIPPQPQTFTGFSQVAFPLTISGDGYKAVLQSVVDFDTFDPSSTAAVLASVRIKFIKTQPFAVTCNYDLCPILYEYGKLLEQADISCDDHLDSKIKKINRMITQALLVKLQPACGVDLGKLIEDIKAEGGWDCDCNCAGPIGLNTGGTSTPGNLNITFTTDGDVTGVANVNGNNIVLTIKDYRYIVNIASFQDNHNHAFRFIPSENGKVRTFSLDVDLDALADDLLDRIGGSEQLTQALNALIKTSFNFTVDGRCIINTNATCDYEAYINDIPENMPRSALVKSITIDDVIHQINISFSYQGGGFTEIRDKLNALGLGTFTVAPLAVSGRIALQIKTVANNHVVSSVVVFGVGEAQDRQMDITKSNCIGATVFTPSQIVQAIINYLCKIDVSQIRLGYDFVFAGLNADGTLKNIFFKSTDNLKLLIQALANNAAVAINVGNTGGAISYNSLVAILANTTNVIKPADIIFGTRDGVGGQWTQLDILKSIIKSVNTTNDPALLADWCKAVSICNAVAKCNPVTSTTIETQTINVEDFKLVGSNLVFSGFYTNLKLITNVTVTFTQTDDAGNLGTTGQVVMPMFTNVYNNAINALPSLVAGKHWVVTGVSGAVTKYLRVQILNNGVASYKVGYRKQGSTSPFTYSTYPAQTGNYTTLVFLELAGNYEVNVIAVCGPNNESSVFSYQTQNSCPTLRSFSAVRSGNDIIVSYGTRVSVGLPVPSVNLVIEYPNGGRYDEVHAASLTGSVTVPLPVGIFGDFKVTMRSVCDESANWFGPFTNPLTLTITTTDNVSPLGLVYTNVLGTTATASAVPPSPAPNAISITLILTPPGGPSVTYTQSPNNLVWNLTALTPATQYNAQVRYDYANGQVSAVFDGGPFTTLPAADSSMVYSGWSDLLLTSGNVASVSLVQSQILPDLADTEYNVDFHDAPQYKSFVIREKSAAPVKISFSNGVSNEPIPDYTFAAPVVIGSYRYYFTARKVSFDQASPVTLKATN